MKELAQMMISVKTFCGVAHKIVMGANVVQVTMIIL